MELDVSWWWWCGWGGGRCELGGLGMEWGWGNAVGFGVEWDVGWSWFWGGVGCGMELLWGLGLSRCMPGSGLMNTVLNYASWGVVCSVGLEWNRMCGGGGVGYSLAPLLC